jgi:hypothetical protein
MQVAYNVLVGRTEIKRPLGRPSRRWEDNITMRLQQVGWRGMDWFIWLRIVTAGERSGSIKHGEFF